jgi:hypothetical protein
MKNSIHAHALMENIEREKLHPEWAPVVVCISFVTFSFPMQILLQKHFNITFLCSQHASADFRKEYKSLTKK